MSKFWPPKKRLLKEGEPLKVEAMFKAVVASLGLDTKAAEFSVLALWQEVVEATAPQFAHTTQAKRLKKEQKELYLLVEAKDAMVASNLQFYLPEILKVLNDYQPQTGLTLSGIRLQQSQRNK
jgi:hypothetical protein